LTLGPDNGFELADQIGCCWNRNVREGLRVLNTCCQGVSELTRVELVIMLRRDVSPQGQGTCVDQESSLDCVVLNQSQGLISNGRVRVTLTLEIGTLSEGQYWQLQPAAEPAFICVKS